MLRRLTLIALLSCAPASLGAQDVGYEIPRNPPPFLILEQDRLLSGSAFGQEIIALNEAEAQQLRQEGEILDRQFEAEERDLTERRATMDPEAFRELADAFDEKVVATRLAQDEKAQALAERSDQRRREFFRQVGPILLDVLEATGAAAVIEQRGVLVSKQDLNITDEVIKRLDAAHAAGQVPETAPDSEGGQADGQE